jgi:hypothetical protein
VLVRVALDVAVGVRVELLDTLEDDLLLDVGVAVVDCARVSLV